MTHGDVAEFLQDHGVEVRETIEDAVDAILIASLREVGWAWPLTWRWHGRPGRFLFGDAPAGDMPAAEVLPMEWVADRMAVVGGASIEVIGEILADRDAEVQERIDRAVDDVLIEVAADSTEGDE